MSVTLLSQAEPSSKENSESTVADFIVKHIIARQVTVVFGISGANIEDLFVRFSKHLPNIQTVVAKHEFNAVNMADGYAQTTGKLGVVLATSGGGALNLIPALAESHLNGTPLVVLVGQIGIDREGTGAFQDMSGSEWEIDAVKAFQPVCKAVFKIKSAEDFAHAFSSMVDRATEYPVGPIVILLPKDIQNQSVASIDSQSNVVDQNQDVEIAAQETIEPDIQQLAERLRQASFPVFIVGREINTAEAKSDLHHCVHAFSAKVVCAPDAKATFDNFSNSFCGVVGVMGHASAIATVMQSDMCIVIGTSLPEFCRMGIEAALKKVTVVHVSSHLLPVFVRRQLPLLTQFKVPVNEFLAQLAYCVPVHYDRKIEPHGRDSRSVNRLVKEPCTFSYKNIIGIIQDYIEVDANIVLDAGNCAAFVLHHLKINSGNHFLMALKMGGMGYSFGASIGASIARNAKTYVFAGDGAFLMHGNEIHTAVQHNLSIVYFIFNNNAHDMCQLREQLYYGQAYTSNTFKPISIGASIRSLYRQAVTAYDVENCTQLSEIMKNLSSQTGPVVISLDIEDATLPPFLPFSATKI